MSRAGCSGGKLSIKQRESFFLGVMDEDETILVMCPDDTAVYLERVGQAEQKEVAPSLHEFLATIQPAVTPVKEPELIRIDDARPHATLWQKLMNILKR